MLQLLFGRGDAAARLTPRTSFSCQHSAPCFSKAIGTGRGMSPKFCTGSDSFSRQRTPRDESDHARQRSK